MSVPGQQLLQRVRSLMKEDKYNFLDENIETQIDKPADFTSPESLHEKLINIILHYHPSDDISMITKAYELAKKAHNNQKRKSGEPYIIHPICVAIILAELELDKETIAAGLLHDVIEDTAISFKELSDMFGVDVANLVDGVTKLTQLSLKNDKIEMQAENLRKMFLAMAKDIRVILIKLADRLHNMRTLQYMKPEKQKEKARETMDIYSPIAQRLGISKIKVELDDLSLKYLHPDVYYDLSEKLAFRKEQRQQFVDYIIQKFSEHLSEIKIKFQINGRVKHLFSIYKKMVNQNKTLDQIYDVFAIRIIVEDVAACYLALGTAHEIYKPIPGRFKDYIAMPKPNMYQSLHTTLISDTGQPFEVQIRTFEMHKTAEFGIAAHWKYKESGSGSVAKGSEDAKMNWLRQILEWQKDTSDNAEYLKVIKSDLDLFSDSVYCFTPNGDVKNLPAGSNPIDFAYSIHSAVGNKMVGARVNGKLVNIDYPLKSGDRVEIITSQNSKGPSRDWLNIIKSNQARTKIQQWFKNELKEAKGINWPEINKPQFQEKVMKRYAIKDWDSILASLGHGGLKEGQVINKMQEEQKKVAKKDISESALLESLSDNAANTNIRKKSKNGITVKGIEDIAVRFSKCCNPVPGDEIVGFITRGRGVSIHRTDCINVMNLPSDDRTRLIPAEWQEFEDSKLEEKYQTELQIYAHNRTGLIFDIIKIFSENNITINNMNARTNKQDVSTINLVFDIKGREQLTSLIGKMRQIAGVIDIERATG